MPNDSTAEVQLFTDGACSGNPGPGGWACILRHPATGKEKELSGGAAPTTNNQMELMGVISGLESLTRPTVDAKSMVHVASWQRLKKKLEATS